MKTNLAILLLLLGGVGGAGFFILANFAGDSSAYPDPKEYAPNFWFDSEERYYPTSPLDFYYDENLAELAGKKAKQKYDNLSKEEKFNNFKIFYKIDDSGNELVYQYWLFYVFNDAKNEHYGDWELVSVFVDHISNDTIKVVGSAHNGGILNNEIPGYKLSGHSWDYVGKGSHANCVDYEADGNCNFATWKISERTWSSADKLTGLKIEHDSPHYNLRPISEIKDVFGKKYSETTPLISKEKSPTLGMLPVKIGKSKKYVLPIGGDPPNNAWNKKEYNNPNEVVPITPTRIASKVSSKIAGLFRGAGSAIAGIGINIASPVRNIFTATILNESTGTTKTTETIETTEITETTETAEITETAETTEIKPRRVSLVPRRPASPAGGPGEEEAEPVEILETQPESETIPEQTSFYQEEEEEEVPVESEELEEFQNPEPQPIVFKFELPPPSGPSSVSASLGPQPEQEPKPEPEPEPEPDLTAPTTTISRANYSIDSPEFQILWGSEASDLAYYDAQYKFQDLGEWQDWAASTTATSTNYTAERSGAYYFRARAIDINNNTGDWAEIFVVIDLSSGAPIVINEVQINNAEFVELYNTTTSAISLAGYYFAYYSSTKTDWSDPWRKKEFPASAEIKGNGYYLIGLKDYPSYLGNPNADWQPYASSQFNNSTGTIAIFSLDPSATSSEPIDAVGWGTTGAISLYEEMPAGAAPEGESITRDGDHTDTDNNSRDFSISSAPSPTNSGGENISYSFSAAPLWAMFQKDARHSGLASYLSGPTWENSTQATSSWSFTMQARGNSQAVIDAEGTIYVIDSSGIIYAINKDGILRWKFDPKNNGAGATGEADASPALSSDSSRVYSVYTDTSKRKLMLYSINTQDGSLAWSYSPAEDGYNKKFTSPVIDKKGNIYVASNTKLYSLSPDNNLRWEFSPTSTLSSAAMQTRIPVIDDDGYVYLTAIMSNTAGDRYIWKLNSSDGSYIWRQNPFGNNSLSSSFSIKTSGTSTVIYIGGVFTSRLFAIDAADGSKIWGDDTILGLGSISGPIPNFDASGNIYAGTTGLSNSGGFHQVSATGTKLWSFGQASPGANRFSAVVDSQGRIYTSAKNDPGYTVYALKPEDGSIIWSYDVSSEPRGLTIGDGVIYVVTNDGKIYAL